MKIYLITPVLKEGNNTGEQFISGIWTYEREGEENIAFFAQDLEKNIKNMEPELKVEFKGSETYCLGLKIYKQSKKDNIICDCSGEYCISEVAYHVIKAKD